MQFSQIKIQHIPSALYSEVSQKAPLRWSVLKVAEDGTAIGQHGWWKCKDFLNDSVVFLRTGRKFPMYGYENPLVLNEDGAYVALKAVPDFFESNLGYLNSWLEERKMPTIGYVQHDKGQGVEAVIVIPSFYWESTFTISVITSLIRSCVYKAIVISIEEAFAEEPTLKGYLDRVKAHFVVDNRPLWKKLMFKNYQYDGSTDGKAKETPTHTIHNAGLQSWINSGAF